MSHMMKVSPHSYVTAPTASLYEGPTNVHIYKAHMHTHTLTHTQIHKFIHKYPHMHTHTQKRVRTGGVSRKGGLLLYTEGFQI